MAHELDFAEDGQARMAYNKDRGLPWHRLGVAVDGFMTSAQAIEAAQLDWDVTLEPCFQRLSDGTMRPVKDAFLTTRSVDDAVLGRVSTRYVPLQNRDAFGLVDELLAADEACLDTAGALRGGKSVFISAALPSGFKVAGDDYTGHLLLSNSHTGLSAVVAKLVVTRTVCQNTLTAALSEASPTWACPHVTGLSERLQQARDTLQLVSAYQHAFTKAAEELAATRLILTQTASLLKSVLPDRLSSDDNVEAIRRNLATSPTIADDQRKTRWGLFNATTEFLQFGRVARSDEGRFHSVIDGDVSRTRDRMLKVLLTK